MISHNLMTTYARLPIAFERGEGVWLYNQQGQKYLDAIGGIAVCGLGHCHPTVTARIQQQAAQLVHTSNIYRIRQQEALGEKLAAISGMEACFFGNSGAEANECAIKLARLHAARHNVANPVIIVAEGAFHGRTMATLTATAKGKAQQGFAPLLEGFERVPFNDLAAIEALAERLPSVVAVLVEPVQGEGGINLASPEYLEGLRALCDQHSWLLMLDEIQTGNGRTGAYFAFQHSTAKPDVVTTAKGLGNGIPIGACLASGAAAELMQPGSHGSTYGGNPFACAVAMAVIETIEQNDLCGRAAQLGDWLLSGLKSELAETAGVKDIRGKGLMLAVELDRPCGQLVAAALNQHLLINVTAERVIRLLPALTMSDQEAELLLQAVVNLVQNWSQHTFEHAEK